MIKDLIKYRNTFIEFGKYLKANKFNTEDYFKLHDELILGHLINFLSIKGINIVVDRYNYVVAYDTINDISTMKMRLQKTTIISESHNTNEDNEIGVINNLKLGIIEGFKHNETPF